MADGVEVATIVGRYFEALERFDLAAAADCFTEDSFYSHPPYSAEENLGLRHEVKGRARSGPPGPSSKRQLAQTSTAGPAGFTATTTFYAALDRPPCSSLVRFVPNG